MVRDAVPPQRENNIRGNIEEIFRHGTQPELVPGLSEKEREDFVSAASDALEAVLPDFENHPLEAVLSPVFLSRMREYIMRPEHREPARIAMTDVLLFYVNFATRRKPIALSTPTTTRRNVVIGAAAIGGGILLAEVWDRFRKFRKIENHHPFAERIAQRTAEKQDAPPRVNISPEAESLMREWNLAGVFELVKEDAYTWKVKVFPTGGSSRSVEIPISHGARQIVIEASQQEKALLIHVRAVIDKKTLQEGPPMTFVFKETRAQSSITGLDVSVRPFESSEKLEPTPLPGRR